MHLFMGFSKIYQFSEFTLKILIQIPKELTSGEIPAWTQKYFPSTIQQIGKTSNKIMTSSYIFRLYFDLP